MNITIPDYPDASRFRRPLLGWLPAWAFVIWGVLNLYANAYFGFWPHWHWSAGLVNGLTQLIWPLMPVLSLAVGLIWMGEMIHARRYSENLRIQQGGTTQTGPRMVAGFFGVCGIVAGVFLTLASTWVGASIDARLALEKYTIEVQGFQWLYGDEVKPSKSAWQLGTIALKNPSQMFTRSSQTCLAAQNSLSKWTKKTHNTFDYLLQQQMVFLAFEHGCLTPRQVFSYNRSFKEGISHPSNRAEMLFPFLFDTSRQSTAEDLNITQESWCAMTERMEGMKSEGVYPKRVSSPACKSLQISGKDGEKILLKAPK